MQGTVSEALGSVEWKGRDAFGTSFVSITRRGGRTIVGVMSARTDAAAATATVGGLGVLAASIAVGVALASIVGIAGPIAAAAGIAGGGGGAWASTRVVWQRVARRWVSRTNALGSALVAAARRALDDRPTTG